MSVSVNLASLVLGGALVCGVSLAADSGKSSTVRFDDLNVNSRSGVTALYKRIHSAALTVCGANEESRDLSARARDKVCVITAENGAVRSIHSASLTVYYQAKTGRSIGLLVANISN